MSQDFILPDLGEGLTEAEIVAWKVAPGDTVTIDQVIVEVESAKSVVELPTPYAGVIETLHFQVGQTVTAGQAIVTVVNPADVGRQATNAAENTSASTAQDAVQSPIPGTATDGESGAVLIGYGTREAAPRRARSGAARFGKAPAGTPDAATTDASAAVSAVKEQTASKPRAVTPHRSPVVSPIVRQLARRNGFDASTITGSGRDALVLRSDVEAHIGQLGATATAPIPAAETTPAGTPTPGDIRIPISGLRKVVAERLSTSRREIPEATVWMDVDATALLAAKADLQRATRERFSVTALIARFVVAGLRKYPVLNASVDTANNEIVQHSAINLGLAAQTPRGLMVPVVHGAESLTTRQLRDGIGRVVDAATTGSFPPAMLAGGTFTLNNFGALGVDGSAAIINHPEVAILGIGRMMERPWVVNHELAVRTVVELSFVFDHRVCDGGTAAGFLTFVANCIENPIALLGEL